MTRVAGRVERLDAAAGAEVEHAPDGGAHRDLGERRRRSARAEDVVAGEPLARLELAEVRREPPPRVTGRVHGLVGPQVDGGAHLVVGVRARRRGQPQPHGTLDAQTRECVVEQAPRDATAEDERVGEDGDCVGAWTGQGGRGRPDGGDVLLTVQRGRGERSQDRLDAAHGEVGGVEVGTERVEQTRFGTGGGAGAHAPILPVSCSSSTRRTRSSWTRSTCPLPRTGCPSRSAPSRRRRCR
ncbi:hypothetical protein GCM10025864_07580 [Luteimicrobium album]|uniref:Uncharacterized protein n=1 Tax=Luteimicrobium album TaxID=1054550 RepID=A0ABQ6HZP4_9MICO|nr:hypothetical protein GCM10025864_07580 [Luteimicrobium album]